MIELPTETDPVRVVHGDCLDVLRGLPDGCVDAVVTDPPYAITSEASSSVSRTFRTPREPQFFEAWLRESVREFVRVLKPSGAMWMTLDWRGAMALDETCARLNIREPKVGVWDKESIGMGHLLRNSYECFAVVPMAGFERQTASEPDVWRCRWGHGKRTSNHPAEKPAELFRRACRLVSPPGGLILDPFGGSGTTAVAAVAENRRCLLIEKEAAYVDIARKRIEAAGLATPLFAGSP